MHQMRLAEPHATVHEQRVVRAARVLGDLACRGARELVGLAFDEGLEAVAGIERATVQCTGPGLRAPIRCQYRFPGRIIRRHVLATCTAHLEQYPQGSGGADLGNGIADVLVEVILDPVEHEVIRRQQT